MFFSVAFGAAVSNSLVRFETDDETGGSSIRIILQPDNTSKNTVNNGIPTRNRHLEMVHCRARPPNLATARVCIDPARSAGIAANSRLHSEVSDGGIKTDKPFGLCWA